MNSSSRELSGFSRSGARSVQGFIYLTPRLGVPRPPLWAGRGGEILRRARKTWAPLKVKVKVKVKVKGKGEGEGEGEGKLVRDTDGSLPPDRVREPIKFIYLKVIYIYIYTLYIHIYVACAGSLPCHLPDRIYVGARVLLTSYDKTFSDY